MNSESQLLSRCLKGDAAAWDELFDLHYAAAGRFICQVSGDFTPDDVEEICQETFLTVIRNLHSFQQQSQFQTWLFRIAANKAHDWRQTRRAAKRGGWQRPVSLNVDEPDGAPIDPPSHAPGPDRAL